MPTARSPIFAEIDGGGVNGTSYTDTNPAGGTYWYRVRAENYGTYSDYVATTSPVTPPPAVPTNLAVNGQTPDSNLLGWATSGGATSYTVLRQAPGETDFVAIATTTGTGYLDQGLTPQAPYAYEVEATGAGGRSGPSSPLSAATPAPPSAPSNLTAAPSAGPLVTLNWTASTGNVTGYHVERSTDGVNFTELDGTVQGTSYLDNSVSAGSTYIYRVRADWSGVDSLYSGNQPATVPPPVPVGLVVTATTQASVSLAWTASAGAASYTILRKGPSDNSFASIGTSTDAAFTDSGLTPGGAYSYEVEAVNSGGPSSPSGPVSATATGAPGAPTNLTDTINPGPQIVLNWTASAGTLTQYHVERGIDGTSFSEISGTVSGTTYTDSTAHAGGNYYYRVRSDLNGAPSGYSNVVSLAPAVPGNLVVTASGTSVAAAWDASSGTTAYHIERSADGVNFVELTPGPTTNSYSDSTLVPGMTYTYRVRAEDSGFYSGYGNTQTITFIPAAPTNLLATFSSPGQVNLGWDTSVGAITYTILRESAGQAGFTAIGTVTTPGFTDNAAGSGASHLYEVIAGNNGGDSLPSTPASPVATTATAVLGRWIFYNDSYYDGNNTAANAADDAAIAPDKQALLPGQSSSFANYTSFTRGINGIMVDVANLPGTPTAADFNFLIGTTADPSTWTPAPAPSAVLVRPGAGIDGSARIEITWADGTIRNQWMQVTVLANANTGLSAPDVFYFGNLIGSGAANLVNGQYVITVNDQYAPVNDPHVLQNRATIWEPFDYNRDGHVDAIDELDARMNNGSNPPSQLQYMLGAPGTPYLVRSGSTQIQIAWPAATDPSVTSYDVYRNGQLLVSALAGTSYTDSTVSSGTAYSYTIVSRDALGNRSIPSAALSVAAASSGSAAVIAAIPTQTAVEGGTLNLSAPFTDADTSDTHTATINWGDGTSSAGAITESNGSGTIAASHVYASSDAFVATITLLDQNGGQAKAPFNVGVAPLAPSTLTAAATSTSSIQLSWTDTSASPTGYSVEQSYDGVNWTPYQSLAHGAAAFSDTALADGTTYFYRVQATGPGGGSAYSNVASAATPYATPVITTGPTVDANPESGTTASLAVQATDPGGGSAVTYDWTMMSGPPNANPVISYGTSDDGTETGQNATVTFDTAGSYTFQVTVTNGTATTTGNVSVTVNQTASSIDIGTGPVQLQPGATQQFTAKVLDQFENPMSSQPQVTWSAGSGGGTIDAGGMFTAPSQLGSYTVSAAAAGLSSQTQAVVVGDVYKVTITGRSYESSYYEGKSSGDLTVTNTDWISAASPADAVVQVVSGTVTVDLYTPQTLSFPADYPSAYGFTILGLPTTQTTQQSTGRIGLWDGDPNAPGDYDFYWNVTVDAKPPPAPQISFLKFGSSGSGNGAQSVMRDHGPKKGLKYDGLPQWYDGNLNGVVDGTPNPGGVIDAPLEHQYPLSYVRSTPNIADTMKVTANFAAPLTQGEQIEGVTNYNGIVFGPVTVNVAGAKSLTLVADKPLPSTIDSADLTITWEYSSNGGAFKTAEQTTNHLYVTGAVAPHVFETELYIGCNAAKGRAPHDPGDPNPAAADQTVIDPIFAKFAALNISRADGTPLTYYANYHILVSAVPYLLSTGDGECGSWTELLMGTLTAAGVAGLQHAKFYTDPAKLGVAGNIPVGFFAKAWSFTGNGTSGDRVFRYKNVRSGTRTDPPINASGDAYSWLSAEVNQSFGQDQVPGQGNKRPASVFQNHQMVKITNTLGTAYYDPSYGLTYSSILDFDNRAIAAYYKVVRAPDHSGDTWFEIETNPTGLQVTETIIPYTPK